jgi:drug/metabolite transporter (DMT)-like permease
MSRSRITPAIECLVSAAMFGASAPLAKELLASTGPISLAALLYLGAAAGVLPFSLRGGSPERRRSRTHVRYLAGAILFGGILGPVLLLWGLTRTPAASASLWLSLETVATAGFAWLLFREHIGTRTWLAAACVVGASALLAFPFDAGTVTGAGLIALACLCWGLDNNYTSLIDGYTPAQSTLIKGAVAGVVNLAAAFAIEGLPPARAIGPALAVGALSYGLSIMLYIRGAHQLGATRSQMLFATAPLWGVGLAWIGFAEPASTAQLLALAPMAAGIALLLGSHHEHEHEHDAVTHSHSHRHDDDHHDHVHPGLPAWIRHTHEHSHAPVTHSHPHHPDLHHRHEH